MTVLCFKPLSQCHNINTPKLTHARERGIAGVFSAKVCDRTKVTGRVYRDQAQRQLQRMNIACSNTVLSLGLASLNPATNGSVFFSQQTLEKKPRNAYNASAVVTGQRWGATRGYDPRPETSGGTSGMRTRTLDHPAVSIFRRLLCLSLYH